MTTPSFKNNRVGGMGAFYSGSSIRYISPKWQLIKLEKQKGTTCEQHNWTIDPRIPTNQTED